MPDLSLVNTATVNGIYNTVPTEFSSATVTTQIVEGLIISLTHDKAVWVEGELTCTITVTNNASYQYETPEVVDVLDTSVVSLVDNSVQVNGAVSPYTYETATGTLKVSIPTIVVGGSTTITFRVTKD